MNTSKRIAFYMSWLDVDRTYAELVRQIVQKGHTFVYGGSDYGLRKEAADEVTNMKGKISAVSSKEFEKFLRAGCDEKFVTYLEKN